MSKLKDFAWQIRKASHQRLNPWKGERETILVPGVQRSGTNMLMDVLDLSLETDVFHERDPRAFDSYHLRPYVRQMELRDTSHARFFVLKALLDSEKTSELLSFLAPAKAVWMYRNYDDMVNSNLRNWPGGRNQIEDLMRDPFKTGYRAWGMTEETLRLIKRHYEPGMDDASAIALFWYYRNQLFFDQQLDENQNVIVLKYEDVASEPEPTLKWLCEKLDLDFTPRMASQIHAKSIGKRKPSEIRLDIRKLCDQMLLRFEEIYNQERRKP
ncbi:MAG: sulfotransferase [Sphingomonadales bacterium]|jgi:hypothetical protein